MLCRTPNSRLVIVLFLLFALVASAQEMKTRIFVLNARPAEATVEMVQPLLSPEGKVIPDTRLNKLVVRDTPEVLAEIEELLQQIDVHLPQVRITFLSPASAVRFGGVGGWANR